MGSVRPERTFGHFAQNGHAMHSVDHHQYVDAASAICSNASLASRTLPAVRTVQQSDRTTVHSITSRIANYYDLPSSRPSMSSAARLPERPTTVLEVVRVVAAHCEQHSLFRRSHAP